MQLHADDGRARDPGGSPFACGRLSSRRERRAVGARPKGKRTRPVVSGAIGMHRLDTPRKSTLWRAALLGGTSASVTRRSWPTARCAPAPAVRKPRPASTMVRLPPCSRRSRIDCLPSGRYGVSHVGLGGADRRHWAGQVGVAGVGRRYRELTYRGRGWAFWLVSRVPCRQLIPAGCGRRQTALIHRGDCGQRLADAGTPASRLVSAVRPRRGRARECMRLMDAGAGACCDALMMDDRACLRLVLELEVDRDPVVDGWRARMVRANGSRGFWGCWWHSTPRGRAIARAKTHGTSELGRGDQLRDAVRTVSPVTEVAVRSSVAGHRADADCSRIVGAGGRAAACSWCGREC